MSTTLETLLIRRDLDIAIDYVHKVISDLFCDRIDMSKFIITKELTKPKYANKQPHATLAEKLRKRDPGSAPKLGDRVSFVIIEGAERLYSDRAEDPIYALQHDLKLDTKYYLEQQISKPLLRLFNDVVSDARKRLFSGSHMLTKKNNSVMTGPMMKFIQQVDKCWSCSGRLANQADIVCKFCLNKRDEVKIHERSKRDTIQNEKTRIWEDCVKCQGTMELANQCSNRDCANLYVRFKIDKELEKQQKRFEKCTNLSW